MVAFHHGGRRKVFLYKEPQLVSDYSVFTNYKCLIVFFLILFFSVLRNTE